MRFQALWLLLSLCASTSFAQTDSLSFEKVEWESKRLASGMHLRQAWFRHKSLFGANQFIAVIDIKPRSKNHFTIAYEPKVKRRTSEFGQQAKAVAAINGTFFDVKNGGSVDYLRANGQVINLNRPEKGGTRARHQQAAVVMKGNQLSIAKWDGTADWETRLDGQDVMLTGPLLLDQHHVAALDSGVFNTARHPRSVIGITNKHHVLFITVDGRDANAAGMSLFELRKVMQWLHCTDAINLDGGGSTTLWDKKHGVVNYPSDNKKWDHEGQRKVANVILIKRN
ncbi:phosphodiester glycosidase family protein [Mucilaginibacter sp. Bleaf8]|uniref:phosphodiester glycosidase family protein n=1 Tax=Mucilaginibacter sp. Bleaf8 TaxID=2834430 RepID=UPI001BCDED5C|nr:phosphodiester glycosidase family protein [Mucilaginibacter sp. Bleaf8]MBS7566989.1 phosphodiester glycosidase family protein [Mucilaginibacter sp. Bleaf8]